MIPDYAGNFVQARYLLAFDFIVVGAKVVEVTRVCPVSVSWSLPPTVVVDWAGDGNATGCAVFADPEALVFLLATPAPAKAAA